MQVPDNYSRFEIEEKRIFNDKFNCQCCGGSFYDEDMSDDWDYCNECYKDLKQFEIEED